jgi:hypothetical protein
MMRRGPALLGAARSGTASAAPPSTHTPAPTAAAGDLTDPQVSRLALVEHLRARGILTEAEATAEKARILAT